MKTIEKVLSAILTIVIVINNIFPSIVYATSEGQNKYTEEEIYAKIIEFVDYKIEKKIEKMMRDNPKITEEEAIDELNAYFRFFISENYDFDHECYYSPEKYAEEYPNDYSDAHTRELATTIYDEMDVATNDLIEKYLSTTKQNELRDELSTKYFPKVEKIEFDANKFRADLDNWLDNQLKNYEEDGEKAKFLMAFFHEWFYRLRNVFNFDNTVLKGLRITEDEEDLKKIKANKLSMADYLTKSWNRLSELNNLDLLPSEEKLQIELAYHLLAFEVLDAVLDRMPEDISIDDIGDVDEYYEVEDGTIDEYATLTTEDSVWNMFSTTIDSIAGILLWPARVLFVIVPGAVIQLVESLLANVGSEKGLKWITLDDLFFNKIPMIDIDIFSFETAADSTISPGNVLYKIRQNVSGWYQAIRNLSIAISLAVLVYIGIRMAISSIADDKAKYKKMLKDWFVSFLLIFVLHYFMVFVTTANNGLVAALDNARAEEDVKLAQELHLSSRNTPSNMQNRLLVESLESVSFVRGFAYAFIYLMTTAMLLLFLITYIKRMITICFLAMIAPLITITYSIDKAGDGKAQALGKWMGEFVFNVIIQPFHCIIYMVFIQNIMYVLNNTTGVIQVGKVLVVIVLLGFIYKAEDIIRGIFGFKATSLGSAAMLGAAMVAKAQSVAKTAKNIKGAGALSKDIKGIKNPAGLPSSAKNAPAAKPNAEKTPKANNNAGTGGTGNDKKSLGARAAKGLVNANVKTGKFIANNVLSAAVAYGMTGNAGAAYGAHSLGKSMKDKTDNARLQGNIRERQELTRDAYQDYAQNKGLNNKTDRLKEADRLLNADPETLTDPAEKNFAEWLKAEQQMYDMMGSKDSAKDVLKNLENYENSQA